MGEIEPVAEKMEEEALSFEGALEAPAVEGEAEVSRVASEAAPSDELKLGEGLEFAADFETAPSETKAEAEPEQGVSLADLDFSGIDLDLEEAPAEEIEMGAAPAAVPTLELGQGAEAGGEIGSELQAEVNAKLDLARAYLEMGDKEGAREILQEVLSEGDSQQKAEADRLMAEAA
jgi:pilus assembly protein FimV